MNLKIAFKVNFTNYYFMKLEIQTINILSLLQKYTILHYSDEHFV
jgi:hypothetical protein